MGEDIRRDAEVEREANGVGLGDLDVARLHGPAADAVIPVLGAVGGGRVVAVRAVACLGRPADDGAG